MRSGFPAEVPPRQQIDENAVVVARVKRDVPGAAGIDDAAQDVDGLIAIERRHLDGDHVLNLRKLSPELVRKQPSTHGWLKVETHDRHHVGYRSCVLHQLVRAEIAQAAHAQQHGVISQRMCEFRLFDSLLLWAADTCNLHDICFRRFFHRKREHRLIEPDFRIANGELRRMHADSNSACACGKVIACERSLAPFIQLARNGQRERMGGNDESCCKPFADIHQNFPSCV